MNGSKDHLGDARTIYFLDKPIYSAAHGRVIRLPIPWCIAIIFISPSSQSATLLSAVSSNWFRARRVALTASKETYLKNFTNVKFFMSTYREFGLEYFNIPMLIFFAKET